MNICSPPAKLSLRTGFTGMGLSELLATAGVPKGSFYHYFRSKEAFGEAMLQRYFAHYDAEMQALFADEHGDARHQLLGYYAQAISYHCRSECHNACGGEAFRRGERSVRTDAPCAGNGHRSRDRPPAGGHRTRYRRGFAVGGHEPGSDRRDAVLTVARRFAARQIRHSLAPLTSALESIELLLRRRNRNGNNFFY